MEKSGGGGSTMKPAGMENPVARGMDIFWNHAFV